MRRLPTSDPEIWLRANGIYYYRKGALELSLKTNDFKVALQKKKSLLLKIDDFGSGGLSLKVSDVFDDYVESRRKESKRGEISLGTLKEMHYIFGKHLLPAFGKVKLSKLTSPLWDSYRANVKIDVTNHRKVFGHFLRWCKKQGYIKYLPDMDVNKVERRKRRILRPNEMSSIWQSAQGSLKLFISMALFMGMRRSEIMGLEWGRVDFENRALFLDKEHTKTRLSRWITIPSVTFSLLEERMLEQQSQKLKTPFVFPNAVDPKRQAYVSGLRTSWQTCLKRAGLSGEDITWHDLRATCEYYAHKRKDVTPTQLEKFFGSNIDVQRKIYVSFDADDVRGVENAEFIQQVTNSTGKTRAHEPKRLTKKDDKDLKS